MRPRLASLVLLLLALCRPSSADYESFGELVNKPLQDSFNNDGNIMSVIAAANSLLSGNVDFKDEMNNGVACALADTAFEAALKKAMYGTEAVNKDGETELSKAIGLDCTDAAKAATEPGKCFCTDNKVLAYCAAMKYKADKIPQLTVPADKCMKGALAELKLKGTKQLGEEYEFAKMREDHAFLLKTLPKLHDAINVVDEITKNSKPEELKFFCDATNPEVATALEKLFKSDLAYHKINAEFVNKVLFYVEYSEMPDRDAKDYDDRMRTANEEFTAKCAKPEFVSDPFNKCACERTKGLLYCVYNAIGLALKKEEYLKCDAATPTVDAAKKPSGVAPAFLKPKPPKPTTTTAAAPNVTTTEAATGGAATSSSLLFAQLAAAAAALLL